MCTFYELLLQWKLYLMLKGHQAVTHLEELTAG
jgi:hypothetical protein